MCEAYILLPHHVLITEVYYYYYYYYDLTYTISRNNVNAWKSNVQSNDERRTRFKLFKA